MKRDQFLPVLKEECELADRMFRIEKSEGKGSHYRVYVDELSTIVKSGEMSPVYMKIVRKQLGLSNVGG